MPKWLFGLVCSALAGAIGFAAGAAIFLPGRNTVENRSQEYQTKLDELESNVQSLESQLKSSQNSNRQSKQQIKELESKLQALESQLASSQNSNREYSLQIKELKSEVDSYQKANDPAPAPATIIPDDVTYSIINSDIIPSIKRSLDIRLNKKVSEKTLRAIALKLKGQDFRNYERTFIVYLLPGMAVGAGCWATTHFNPDLDVKILGLTIEREEVLKQIPDNPSREVIGNWLDDTMYIGGRISIFRQKNKIFMDRAFAFPDEEDDDSFKKEVVEKVFLNKYRMFLEKEENSFGEFYVIDSQGDLQTWDQEGLISTAKKIGN